MIGHKNLRLLFDFCTSLHILRQSLSLHCFRIPGRGGGCSGLQATGMIVVANFFFSGNFYFSFISTSLAYTTIPNYKRERKSYLHKKLNTTRSNGDKNQNPPKHLDQKLTRIKSHAKFLSLKNFQKALTDITCHTFFSCT